MKICVVTPYFETDPGWLAQGHRSVRAQTLPARHILVCDGSAPVEIADFAGVHLVLRRNYQDYGNTPRLIGCFQAINDGAEAIAFLDADNWYQPDHLEGLARCAQANALGAVCSARTLHRMDGGFMATCRRVNGQPFVDTSCLLVMRRAFGHLINWAMNSQAVAAEVDQVLWRRMGDAGERLGFLDRASVCYRTRHMAHYEDAGEAPPAGAVRRLDPDGAQYM